MINLSSANLVYTSLSNSRTRTSDHFKPHYPYARLTGYCCLMFLCNLVFFFISKSLLLLFIKSSLSRFSHIFTLSFALHFLLHRRILSGITLLLSTTTSSRRVLPNRNTVGPWTTRVWTVWTHLHADFLQGIYWKIVWRSAASGKTIFFSLSLLIATIQYIINITYKIHVIQLFMLSVRLSVPCRLLETKCFGGLKVMCGFLPALGGQHP